MTYFVAEMEEQLVEAFRQFRADPIERLRVNIRQHRAAQLRCLLANPAPLTVVAFQEGIWKFEHRTERQGIDLTGRIFSPDMSGDEAEVLDACLMDQQCTLNGNYLYDLGPQSFGSRLGREEREGAIRDICVIMGESTLAAATRMARLLKVPGVNFLAANILTTLAQPSEWPIRSDAVIDQLRHLGYGPGNAGPLLQRLKGLTAAEDFLVLDRFLNVLNRGTRFEARSRYWLMNGTMVETLCESERTLLRANDIVLQVINDAFSAVIHVGQTTDSRSWADDGVLGVIPLCKPLPLEAIPKALRKSDGSAFTQSGEPRQVLLSPVSRAFVRNVAQWSPATWPSSLLRSVGLDPFEGDDPGPSSAAGTALEGGAISITVRLDGSVCERIEILKARLEASGAVSPVQCSSPEAFASLLVLRGLEQWEQSLLRGKP